MVGLTRIIRGRSHNSRLNPNLPYPVIEVLVPIKGVLPQSKEILETLLTQDYPNYHVTFILENQLDPAVDLVREFCSTYGHVSIFFSGTATGCGQKNFGLSKAISQLGSDVEILAFCDSSNAANDSWLARITEPVRSRAFEVCTTFRSFSPGKVNIAGICQAMYATTVFSLMTVTPKPWGGATVIRKRTFDSLNVAELWLRTVVDDLVLGNILNRANVKICVSPANYLVSPVEKQTLKGFSAYLDRQILFPKFTNPAIWFFTVTWDICLAASLALSMAGIVLYLLSEVSMTYALTGAIYWIGIFLIAIRLRHINQPRLPVLKWITAFPVMVVITTVVCVRSIFLDHIDWHGKRYYCGPGGVVTEVQVLKN